jgi:hypothetical protein
MFLVSVSALAAPSPDAAIKAVRPIADRAALTEHLRARGYKTRGGIDKGMSDRQDASHRSLPHFTSSLRVQGVPYPFTMVGSPPASGRSSNLRSVIIPLRMNFIYFGANQDVNITFEPGPAVANIVGSPLYVPAAFPNGVGQFGDQMQRAAFWNQMDEDHAWHVRMATPTVAPTVDIEVTPETGALYTLGSDYLGDVLIDFMDAQILTILQFLNLDPDVVPIFVTGMTTAEALGYHSAYVVPNADSTQTLRTYMYTSWLDPAKVNPLFADVSTFNHELMEWMNDPFINNVVPMWQYPPASDPAASCSFNNLLEVGDPQGNGPTYADYPTVVVPVGGISYHLQQLVLWQWFTGQRPSSAYHGWYSFPDPSSLREPAVFCP